MSTTEAQTGLNTPKTDSNSTASKSEPTVLASDLQNFEYHPVPALAPVSAIMGAASLLAFLSIFGIVLSIISIPIGLLAIWKIRASEGLFRGLGLSSVGLVLAAVSCIGGIALQIHYYKTEVPEGFERVSFSQDISNSPLSVNYQTREPEIPEEIKALDGKKILLKGFMYPQQQTEGLTSFLLLKDSGECCFGGQPELTDMIGVLMKESKTVSHDPNRVSLAGTFRINPDYSGESLEPLYLLDGVYFSPSLSAF